MTMAEKHLRDLLKEDQEPFLLKHYISERRSQLKKPSPSNTTTLLKKKQPQPQQRQNLSLNECFLSLHSATKSPLLQQFSSPNNNNNKTTPLRPSNAKTATLLLEAALRIHNNNKPNRSFRFNLFGSLFKRLVNRNKQQQIQGGLNDDVGSTTCSCNDDMELSFHHSPIQSLSSHHYHHDFFCETPFRFSLQRTPATLTPDFSPPLSPTPLTTQDKEINGVDGVNKFQSGEEEEDKEQCSPVSVLDPPFHYDDDDENDHGDIGFDLDCSYAHVQRTKQHLLDRLRSFEKLAELDPIELEKRMLDQEDHEFEDDDYEDVDSETTCEEKALRNEVFEILCHSRVHDIEHPPEDLKRLVYDLIMEEETQVVNSAEERNMVIRRVLRRLELWKEVESNTIDMMIEDDISREEGKWKINADKTKELAVELEVAIFCLLVEELSEELAC